MLKFSDPIFLTFMNKPDKIRLQETPTILFVIGAFLSVLSLTVLFTQSSNLLTWNEFSELIPIISKVDSFRNLQLENQLFLIRQSYYIHFLEADFKINVICSIISLIGLAYLLIGFQSWSKINPRQFIFGIVLWIGIVVYNNAQHGFNDWILLIQQQINYAGILAVFVWAILSSQAIPAFIIQLSFQLDKKNNVQIWYLLGFIYFINLVLSFGNLLNYWESNLYIPSSLFWIISSTIFLFQTLKFQERTKQIIFFGLFLLAITTFTEMHLHQNDPGIKAIETWNMMCQIAMSLVFPAFIYTNFKDLISVQLPIFKVFHKAQKLPIYLIHLGIFLLTTAWVFAMNTAVFHQIMAGKSNQEGDNAYLLKEYTLADIHYKNALTHSKLNTKSNLSLAHLAHLQNQEEEQAYYLSNTLVKNPQAETFIALSYLYAKNDHLFESLFNLKKGLGILPNNIYLMNQLAINFEKLNQLDSAKYFYRKAFELASENEIAIANYVYFESKYPTKKVLNELFIHQKSENIAIQNNVLLYSAQQHQPLPKTSVPADFEPKLDVRDWAILYNTTSLLKEKAPIFAYTQWKKIPEIQKIFPEVNFLEAWQNYYHQKPLIGLDQLSLMIAQDTSARSRGLQNILGYWKEKALNSVNLSPITNLQSAKKALESHPFNLHVLQKAIPILNQNQQQKLAYQYALSVLRYNEQIATYYPIYAQQALEIAEIQYAKEAMETLKKLDPMLYQREIVKFEKKLDDVIKRRVF
ncbi:hypothetical protein V7S79_06115 [Aquirufa sp. ROCK-SH2]